MHFFFMNILKIFLSYAINYNIYGYNALYNAGKNDKGFVIAANHPSRLDSIYISCAVLPKSFWHNGKKLHLNYKEPYFIAKDEFKGFFFTHILNFIPVNRKNPKSTTIKKAVSLLKEGKILSIAPAGTMDDKRVNLKRGAIHIAQVANVPILAACIVAPELTIYDLLLGLFKTRRYKKNVSICFGNLIDFKKIEHFTYSELKSYQVNSIIKIDNHIKELKDKIYKKSCLKGENENVKSTSISL